MLKYQCPFLLVPSTLQQLCSTKVYTKFDLCSDYNLVYIREGEKWNTALSTTSSHFDYCVTPCGLSCTPSVFQCLIRYVRREMLGKFGFTYFENILIYSPSLETHVRHVKQVLSCLLTNQCYIKGEKCEFCFHISFLGYIIGPKGEAMDKAKVVEVTDRPTPKTKKELQHFLELPTFTEGSSRALGPMPTSHVPPKNRSRDEHGTKQPMKLSSK